MKANHRPKPRWHRERVTLLVFLLLAGSTWCFFQVAEVVQSGSHQAFDETALRALRTETDTNDPIGPSWFEDVMRDVTALGGYTVITLMVLSVVACLLLQRRWNMAVMVVAGVLGAMLFSTLLKEFFDRPRPDLVPHATRVYTNSFPSAHAMMSAATYLTLASVLVRLQRQRSVRTFLLVLAVGLTLAVGFSRVYLGVHWPSDVLAGWAAGAAWALFCWLMVARLGRSVLGKDRLGSKRLTVGGAT